ncbi:hypothetical protein CUT44_30215 [Streptomyces carminius]|uniref:DUF6879 domain-containing protein n=1 Tax=Streptomyces carminius TaxID=2665496 RepID=A0A2M8LRA0_9ACTN|nr:DUF6879 family protein [Streptomyces carminius]PJE94491.1 hypothetical protein CUT44_30215 [Streptomyces carminius]
MVERPTFDELFAECSQSAVHLEMRDMYTPDDPTYLDWKAGVTYDPVERFRDWHDLIVTTVARGVEVRRARVVSEPVTDFVRHEYETTSVLNIPSGERVRWLSRRLASDLALPGNDFWVFDNRLVRFGHFSGDGTYLGQELVDDPAVVKLCCSAFEAVWERAVDHTDYRPK